MKEKIDWNFHNAWEKDWWGSCANTMGEELKQQAYAKKMGLKWTSSHKTSFILNGGEASIMDIGGGPVSLLLKTARCGRRYVVDPCDYPPWVSERYRLSGIQLVRMKAEELKSAGIPIVDECWMYNCLQHVGSPEDVITAALEQCKIFRVCEPVGTRISNGHPHSFDAARLNSLLGGEGKVEHVRDSGVDGVLYFGIFKGRHYEE